MSDLTITLTLTPPVVLAAAVTALVYDAALIALGYLLVKRMRRPAFAARRARHRTPAGAFARG